MIPAIKSEFRKLFSVRSTYFLLGSCLLIEIFFAFWATAFKANASDLHDPNMLSGEVTNAVMFLSTLVSLLALLLVTHEYRYNTIVYTLTAAKSRTRVFVAKVFAISVVAAAAILIFGTLSPLLATLGVHASGRELVHQNLPIMNLLWRVVFTGWGFSMLALILAFIIRIQVGAIVAVFIGSGTIEQLIGLLIKKNQVYLPFHAVNEVIQHDQISYQRAALVATAYIVGGWLIAWILFLRRDAN